MEFATSNQLRPEFQKVLGIPGALTSLTIDLQPGEMVLVTASFWVPVKVANEMRDVFMQGSFQLVPKEKSK